MSMSGSVVVAIKAVDEASSVFGKIQASLGVLGGAIGQLGGPFTSVGNVISGFAGAGVLGAVAAGAGEATKALQWSVQQAVASEEIWNRLRFAVEKQGGSWAVAEAGVRAFAAQLQTTTRYSDEQTAVALQTLMNYGMDLDTAMRTVGSAMDFASAKQIDLTTACDLLGKAYSGNTSLLGRYGLAVKETEQVSRSYKDIISDLKDGIAEGAISTESLASFMGALGFNVFDASGKMMTASEMIRTLNQGFADGQVNMGAFTSAVGQFGISTTEAKDKAATFDSVMGLVNERFGGAAQSDASTYAGMMAQFNNVMGELGEKIGFALLPSLTSMASSLMEIATFLGPLIDQIITDVGPAMADCGAAFADLSDAIGGSGNIIKDILSAVGNFLKYEIIGWSKIFEFLAKAVQGWITAFKAIATALAPVGAAIGAFIGQVQAVVGSVIAALTSAGAAIYATFATIYNVVSAIWNAITGTVTGAVSAVVSFISGGFNSIYNTVSGVFNAIYGVVKGVLDAIWGTIQGFIDACVRAFEWLWSVLTGGSIWPEMMEEMQKQTKTGLGEVGKLFETGLEVGVLKPAAAAAPPAVGPSTILQREFAINFTIQGVTDPDEVARQVESRLVEVLSRRSEVTAG